MRSPCQAQFHLNSAGTSLLWPIFGHILKEAACTRRRDVIIWHLKMRMVEQVGHPAGVEQLKPFIQMETLYQA